MSGRKEHAPLRRLPGSRPFVPKAPRDGLRGQTLRLDVVRPTPGWSAPLPGSKAEPPCPGSSAGKTQTALVDRPGVGYCDRALLLESSETLGISKKRRWLLR